MSYSDDELEPALDVIPWGSLAIHPVMGIAALGSYWVTAKRSEVLPLQLGCIKSPVFTSA